MKTALTICFLFIWSYCASQRYYLTFNWSPDGKQIITSVESWQGDKASYQLMLIDVESGVGKIILNKGWAPAWSPDGKRITYTAKTSRGEEIFIANADGTSERQLTTNDWDDTEPCFSPDGRQILFGSKRNGKNQVFRMSVNGSKQEQVFLSEESAYTPSWSSDGNKILYYKDKGDRMDKVSVYDLLLGSETLVTNNALHNFYPSWTSDGNILMSMAPGGKFEMDQVRMVMVNGKGDAITQVGDFAAWYSRMSPDGRIAFTRMTEGGDELGFRNEIFVCDRTGNNSRLLTTH